MMQLAYISYAADSFGSGDVSNIIGKSVRNNVHVQVTGLLIYANGRFFQVIKGLYSAIDDPIDRLKRDPLPDDDTDPAQASPLLADASAAVKAAAEKLVDMTAAKSIFALRGSHKQLSYPACQTQFTSSTAPT
ncbi:MAG: BLUF domain-containing protein [Erythrobacter sp.]|uniref:BLUF domain-containing protein n=1 Tax=Erythrobacter sp. TaxID=1042 RepID=UPI0032973C40